MKFKVGDKAVVIHEDWGIYYGTIVEIIRLDEEEGVYSSYLLDDEEEYWFNEELELLEIYDSPLYKALKE